MARHEKAFLEDISSGKSSRSFRRRQESVFGNLKRVPLSTWSYTVGGRTDDRSFEGAATKKYGTPAMIVRLSVHYALRGVDQHSTTHDLWWTFIERNGKVVIAGDSDLAAGGGRSWQGPWDFGPLKVLRGRFSLVLGHPDNIAVLPVVAATVASAVPAVTAVWGTHWSRTVAVLLPSSPAELGAEAGAASQVDLSVAAVATSDGQDPLTGAVLGQRLIVNPQQLARLSAVGRRIVVRHEITHIATAAATSDSSPRWLVEGFADYVGNLGTGQPVPVAAAELSAQVRRGRLPAALPTEADFDTAGTAAPSYESAWLACRLIATRAGRAGLVRFYRLVGANLTDADTAVAAALRAVLHESVPTFVAQWRNYLRAQLGG